MLLNNRFKKLNLAIYIIVNSVDLDAPQGQAITATVKICIYHLQRHAETTILDKVVSKILNLPDFFRVFPNNGTNKNLKVIHGF